MDGQRVVGRDYTSIIKQILTEYSQINPANGEIDREVIFDDTGKHYQLKHKIMLGLLQLSQLVFILSFIVLIINVHPIYLIVAVFLFRYCLQMLIFKLSANKIGGKDLVLLAPFYELFFMIFNPVLVISNLLIKKIKWN